MTEQSIFVKCKCGTCNILEFRYVPYDNQFEVSIWVAHPGELPLSKKERVRWCEEVTKTGIPWADHTIVDKKDATRIAKFLNKYISNGKRKRS